jgi:peptide chain release factor 3
LWERGWLKELLLVAAVVIAYQPAWHGGFMRSSKGEKYARRLRTMRQKVVMASRVESRSTHRQNPGLLPPDSLLFFPAFVNITEEILKRRTFAIISHPDAGKTTLTEKLLLYGGAVQLAGSVTARKNQRATTSDWMELEKKRGISISSTVLQFDYNGYRLNLLDTPGHKDFSEDTYRVLTAVDSVVMVIDSAKGIEPQTRKLFEVCRQRGVPIFTFMNKCDRPMKDPLALLDELERVLGIGAFPVNWPIGNGFEFQGVYDRQTKLMHLFERTVGGQFRAPVQVGGLDDPAMRGQLDDATFHKTVEELEMLEHAGHDWDDTAVLSEKTTPVFFGSASNNFGVQLLLDGFLKHSPPPKSRVMGGIEISPEHPHFSGFIFKIQANMDPKHRDRIAFVRVCSGKFERDMSVHHSRSAKKVRLSSSHKLFGNERETVDEAWPGDVIGLVGHDSFGIGDTLTTDPKITYKEIPRFTPEAFSYLHNPNTAKFKQFRQGLEQLMQEGVIQALYLRNSSIKTPLLAAVGPLQFEVVQFRLESEYGAVSRLEAAPWTVVRWLPTDMKEDDLDALSLPTGSRVAYDVGKNPVVLFPNEWAADYFAKTNERVPLSALPVQTARE